MSSEDTRVSAEVIVDTLTCSVQREMDDGHGSSLEFESISSSPEIHKLMLLMRVCTYEGGALEPKLSTRSNICDLCLECKGQYDPYDIEVMSHHEVCLMFKEEVTLGDLSWGLNVSGRLDGGSCGSNCGSSQEEQSKSNIRGKGEA